jgi:hypothetical protein
MDEQQIHGIQLQALQTGSSRAAHGFRCQLVVPNFGGDKQLFAIHAALLQAFAHRGFIIVTGSGVDVAVAQLYGLRHGVTGFLTFQLPSA